MQITRKKAIKRGIAAPVYRESVGYYGSYVVNNQ